jgi:hypothetical protein
MDQQVAGRSAALAARIDQAQAELDGIKRQLAVIQSLICQCQPEREHNDYTRPAGYLHAADCPVTAVQQQADALTQEGTR